MVILLATLPECKAVGAGAGAGVGVKTRTNTSCRVKENTMRKYMQGWELHSNAENQGYKNRHSGEMA